MNSAPAPHSDSTSSTPFDAPPAPPPAPEEAQAQRQAAEQARTAEQAAIDAKMALLPDYSDEAFPCRATRSRGTARGSGGAKARGFGPDVKDEDAVDAPGSVVAGGCLCGMAGNVVLGFALLALQRAGVALYGPGVLAILVALVVLALLIGTWPRRVWLAAGGFLLGLVLCFGALFLFVRPALDPVSSGSASATIPQGDARPPAEASEAMQPS